MKILIRDYSSEHSTEPQDLYIALKSIGLKPMLWNEKLVSAFDSFDKFNPDLFINSGDFSNSLRKRLRLCETPIIHRLKSTEDNFVKNWFKERAVTHKEPSPCNLFINEIIKPSKMFDGKINYAIITNVDTDYANKIKHQIGGNKTRHVISTSSDIDVNCDIYLPIGQIYSIANNYEEIFISPEFPDSFKLNLALMGYNVNGVSQNQAITRTVYDFLIKIISGHLGTNTSSGPVNNLLFQLYNICDEAKKHIQKNFNILDNTK